MIGAIAGGAAAGVIQARQQGLSAEDPHARQRAMALCARDLGGILGLLLAVPAGLCIDAWISGTFQWEAHTPAPWWHYLILTCAFAIPSIACLTASVAGWWNLRKLPPMPGGAKPASN